jgi:hypothetical protein
MLVIQLCWIGESRCRLALGKKSETLSEKQLKQKSVGSMNQVIEHSLGKCQGPEFKSRPPNK